MKQSKNGPEVVQAVENYLSLLADVPKARTPEGTELLAEAALAEGRALVELLEAERQRLRETVAYYIGSDGPEDKYLELSETFADEAKRLRKGRSAQARKEELIPILETASELLHDMQQAICNPGDERIQAIFELLRSTYNRRYWRKAHDEYDEFVQSIPAKKLNCRLRALQNKMDIITDELFMLDVLDLRYMEIDWDSEDAKAIPEDELDRYHEEEALKSLYEDDGCSLLDVDSAARFIHGNRKQLTYEQIDGFFRYVRLRELLLNDISDTQRAIAEANPRKAASILPEVLAGDDAKVYWDRLKKAGFIRDNFQRTEGVTRQQTMYIALCFAEALGIKSKWSVFEPLWGIKNLAQEYNKMTESGKCPPRASEIDSLFRN